MPCAAMAVRDLGREKPIEEDGEPAALEGGSPRLFFFFWGGGKYVTITITWFLLKVFFCPSI